MRILLDQNTPIGVRRILATQDVRTASQMGWSRLSNGDLLDAAEQAGFEALITCDQNFPAQQNLAGTTLRSLFFPPTGGKQSAPSLAPFSTPPPAPAPEHLRSPPSALRADRGGRQLRTC
jgi:hypothetical protein